MAQNIEYRPPATKKMTRGTGHAETETETVGTPPILRIPVDVLRLILDELPLHMRFFLSQTCRPLRSRLELDWSKTLGPDSASRDEQMRFFEGLASVLPDFVACLRCVKLHRVDVGDTPYTRQSYFGYSNYSNYSNCPEPDRNALYKFGGYSLVHEHVRQAQKYTRLLQVHGLHGHHQRHLKKLMAPFDNTSNPFTGLPPGVLYTKTPRIVAGRFLIHTTFECMEGLISVVRYRPGFFDRRMVMTSLCRHTDVPQLFINLRDERHPGRHGLGHVMHELASQRKNLRSVCPSPWCKTDFLARFTCGKWIFHAWQDLGSEEEAGIGVDDPFFRNHRWRATDVGHLQQLETAHVPRSIELLWDRGHPDQEQYPPAKRHWLPPLQLI